MPITPFCIAMTLSVAACNAASDDQVQTASGAFFKENLVAEMPNGCSLYLYDFRGRNTNGQNQAYYGQYIVCDGSAIVNGQPQRMSNRGGQQHMGGGMPVDPAELRRARVKSKALARLSAEERDAMGID